MHAPAPARTTPRGSMPPNWTPTSRSWKPSACSSTASNSSYAPRVTSATCNSRSWPPPAPARGQLTMTELADGVVYSRSGLTYQAALLEKAGLITRGPSLADDRATLVSITDSGRALLGRVMPGHVLVVRRLLLDPLSQDDLDHLGDIMIRVRDHMRPLPPRSAAPRKRRPAPTPAPTPASPAPDATR